MTSIFPVSELDSHRPYMSSPAVPLLRDVDAYMFDVFGTTVDWFTTVKREVARRSNGALSQGAFS